MEKEKDCMNVRAEIVVATRQEGEGLEVASTLPDDEISGWEEELNLKKLREMSSGLPSGERIIICKHLSNRKIGVTVCKKNTQGVTRPEGLVVTCLFEEKVIHSDPSIIYSVAEQVCRMSKSAIQAALHKKTPYNMFVQREILKANLVRETQKYLEWMLTRLYRKEENSWYVSCGEKDGFLKAYAMLPSVLKRNVDFSFGPICSAAAITDFNLMDPVSWEHIRASDFQGYPAGELDMDRESVKPEGRAGELAKTLQYLLIERGFSMRVLDENLGETLEMVLHRLREIYYLMGMEMAEKFEEPQKRQEYQERLDAMPLEHLQDYLQTFWADMESEHILWRYLILRERLEREKRERENHEGKEASADMLGGNRNRKEDRDEPGRYSWPSKKYGNDPFRNRLWDLRDRLEDLIRGFGLPLQIMIAGILTAIIGLKISPFYNPLETTLQFQIVISGNTLLKAFFYGWFLIALTRWWDQWHL